MTSTPNPGLPWPAWLRLGLVLGLSPEAFWALSLREWRALLGTDDPALTSADLARLCARFPDAPSLELYP